MAIYIDHREERHLIVPQKTFDIGDQSDVQYEYCGRVVIWSLGLRLCPRTGQWPLFRGARSCSADSLAGAFSLRYPDVRQASIDKQADGSRAWDTVSGGPEFDAFEHLGWKAQRRDVC